VPYLIEAAFAFGDSWICTAFCDDDGVPTGGGSNG
jgi:hypothetical protein